MNPEIKHFEFKKEAPIPLYFQIKEDIKEQINRGTYKPNDKLPTEKWLSEHYGVSRVTIRKTLDSLIADGAVERERGKGIFVAEPKLNRRLNQLTSLYRAFASEGIKIESNILRAARQEPDTYIGERMGLEEGENILYIHRIRLADGKPIVEQKMYIREKFCPGFDANRLKDSSFYDILENDYQIKMDHSDVVIDTKLSTAKQSEYLDIPHRSPLLYVTNSVYMEDGNMLEFSENYYVSSRYKYSLTLYG